MSLAHKLHPLLIRGFTLVELLVVIAIIGVLASIIEVSLFTARSKGKDARVISDIKQLRLQIETDNNSGAVNYGVYPAGTSFNSANTLINSGNYASLQTDITTNGALAVVTNGASPVTAYALYGTLSTGKYFCVDSNGKTNPAGATNNTVACP